MANAWSVPFRNTHRRTYNIFSGVELAMTQQTTLGNVCPMFGDMDCRFLSQERISRPFTRLELDPTTKLYKPIGMGSRKVVKGMYCNNHGADQDGWIETMNYCPARWARYRGTTKKEGKGK